MRIEIKIRYKSYVLLHILLLAIWRIQFENLQSRVSQVCYYMSERSFEEIAQ